MDENISFIKLKNYSDGKKYFYPFCLISSEKTKQDLNFPAASTGTASHITKEKNILKSSPETQKYGYHTVRVVAPELIPMNFPGCTYDRHPYFVNTGGITNEHLTQPLP